MSRHFKVVVIVMASLGFLIVAGLIALAAVGYWYTGGPGKIYIITGPSMQPTLHVNDKVHGNNIDPNTNIQRGWVVAFKVPSIEKARDPQADVLVKRVVAVPGDTVESRDGVLYVNGSAVSEPYLAPGTQTNGITRLTLAPNQYYVLGDDRADSADSRAFGPVDRSLITYHMVKVVSPLDRRNTKLP